MTVCRTDAKSGRVVRKMTPSRKTGFWAWRLCGRGKDLSNIRFPRDAQRLVLCAESGVGFFSLQVDQCVPPMPNAEAGHFAKGNLDAVRRACVDGSFKFPRLLFGVTGKGKALMWSV